MPSELQIPPGAKSDVKACELVRAWAAHGGLHCSLNVNAWSDDQVAVYWGILLSDIARHVADALFQSKHANKDQTISAIRSVFNSELGSPTAKTDGEFV